MPNPNTAFRTGFSALLCSLLLLDHAASWSLKSAPFSRGVRMLLQNGIEQYETEQTPDDSFVSIPIDVVNEASIAAAPIYTGWPEVANTGPGCELLQKEGCAYCEVIDKEPLCLACRVYFRTLENGTCVRDPEAPSPGPEASYDDDYAVAPEQDAAFDVSAPEPAN